MKRTDLAAFALIAFAMLRIASTWTTFSATIDEPMHITAGLELYSQHTYTYQPENPPLPRLVLALGPWLGGMQFDPALVAHEQLQRVFYTGRDYATNLILARCGNLLFFALAALGTWLWARRELGSAGALIAILLFTMQPMIAGHAGVATHDMAATATFAFALLAFVTWLDGPAPERAAWLGVAVGLSILCKFSNIGYVPAAALAIFLFRRRRFPPAHLAVSLIAMTTVIAAGYAFQLGTFWKGIQGLRAIDQAGGHYGYLFGEISTQGWWWYFPAALALKTTIASLLLALLAIPRRVALPMLAAVAAVLLVAMPSNLDLGLRYVLPLYVPLSIAGAAVALTFVKHRWLPLLLLVWHSGASLVAHPDTFAYFNEPAASRPWEYLIDSNIDWGQDALRLRRVLEERKVERVGLAIFGWHEWDELGFPPHYEAYPTLPTQGWIAVSEHLFQLKRFAWLRGRRYERVGKSIRLYYIP